MKNFLLICISLVLSLGSFSQNIIWNNPFANISDNSTVCFGEEVLMSDFTLSGVVASPYSVQLVLPFATGMNYASHALTMPAGVTESIDLSNPNRPVLTLSNIPLGNNNFSLFVRRAASCAAKDHKLLGGVFVDTVEVYDANTGILLTDGRQTSAAYDVIYASLAINPASISNTPASVAPFSPSIRCVDISMGGQGTLTAFRYKDVVNGSIDFDLASFTINGNSIPASSINLSGGNLEVSFTKSLLVNVGDLDSLFEQNESFTLCYEMTPNGCGTSGNISSDLYTEWGCDGAICTTELPFKTASLGILPTSGSTTAVLAPISLNNYVCLNSSDPSAYAWRAYFVNGKNVPIYLNKIIPGLTYPFLSMDTANIQYKIGSSGLSLHPVHTEALAAPSTSFIMGGCNRFHNSGASFLTNPYLHIRDTLMPGDTLFLDIPLTKCCTNSCIDFIPTLQLQYYASNLIQFEWSDLCTISSMNNTNTNYHPVYPLYRELSSIDGPTDLVVGQTEDICTFFPDFRFEQAGGNNTGNLLWVIDIGTSLSIPLSVGSPVTFSLPGGALAQGLVINKTATRVEIQFQLTANGLVLCTDGAGRNLSQGSACLPIEALCGTGGVQTYSQQFIYTPFTPSICLADCPTLQFGCKTYSITVHCPNPCTGITLYEYDVHRANLGLPDNNNDGLPDASGSLNLSQIIDYRYVPGDTLEAVYYGVVSTDLTHPQWEYAYATVNFPTGSPLTKYDIIPPSVLIKKNLGATYTFVPSYSVSGNNIIFDLQTNAPVGVFPLLSNDSIILTAQYQYKFATSYGPIPATNYTLPAYLYGAHIPNPSASADQFGCDSWNGVICPIEINIGGNSDATQWTWGQDTDNACGAYAYLWHQFYIQLGEGIYYSQRNFNYFPYEFRSLYLPDTVMIDVSTLPSYATYAYTKIYGTILNGAGMSQVNGGYVSTLNPVSTTASMLKFPIKDVMKYAYNPVASPVDSLLIGEEGYGVRFMVYYNIACPPNNESYLPYQTLMHTKGLYEPSNMAIESTTMPIPRWSVGAGMYDVANYPSASCMMNANLQLSTPLRVQNMVTNPLSYQVTLTNDVLPNRTMVQVPDSVWMYVPNTAAFTINQITRAGIPLVGVNGFYRLGRIERNARHDFVISTNLTDCSARDSFPVIIGYQCAGLPTDISTANCIKDTLWLVAIPQVSRVSVSLTALSATPSLPQNPASPPFATSDFSICEDIPVEITINSTDVGSLFQVIERLIIPLNSFNGQPGLDFVSNSGYIEYPENTAPRPFSSAANAALNPLQPLLNFDLAQIDPTNFNNTTGSLMGVPGISDLSRNTVVLRFMMHPNCNIQDLTNFNILSLAQNQCAEPALNSGEIVVGYPLDIREVILPTHPSLTISPLPTTLNGCTNASAEITVMAVKDDALPVGNDTIWMEIPAGLAYQLGSFNCNPSPQNICPLGGPIQRTVAGINYLLFPLDAATYNSEPNYGQNDSTTFSLYFEELSAPSCALNYDSIRVSIQNTQSLSCVLSGLVCPDMVQITANHVSECVVHKPAFLTSNIIIESLGGGMIEVQYTLENTGLSPYSGDFFAALYSDVDHNQTVNLPPDILVARDTLSSLSLLPGGSIFVLDTLSLNAYTLQNGDEFLLQADTTSNTQCICSISSDTTIIVLPIQLLSTEISAQNCQVEVKWQTTSSQNLQSFDIERARNGNNFEVIGTVNGAENHFHFWDNSPASGDLYYKISSKDEAGNKLSSNTLHTYFVCESPQLQFFPNPADQFLNIQSISGRGSLHLQLFNTLGELVLEREESADGKLISLDISKLSSGLYYLSAKDELYQYPKQSFTKQ